MDPSQYLRDIRGLDPLPWWPVAPGWWWLLGALALLVALGVLLRWWWRRVRHNWRDEAHGELRELRRRIRRYDTPQALSEMAVLMRRIAMARHGRRACAGLIGEQWLAWLETNDPQGFPWRREGRILIELLYAPPGAKVDHEQLLKILDAMEVWTRPQPEGQQQSPWLERIRILRSAGGEARV
jgi:hypothetical protein